VNGKCAQSGCSSLWLVYPNKGMSIALLCQTLNGQGNTPRTVGKALLTCFDKWIDYKKGQQIWSVADREYIGKEWFEALSGRGMQFCIRLLYPFIVSVYAKVRWSPRQAEP